MRWCSVRECGYQVLECASVLPKDVINNVPADYLVSVADGRRRRSHTAFARISPLHFGVMVTDRPPSELNAIEDEIKVLPSNLLWV